MFCTNPECPDLQATGVPGEYVDGVVSCPVCGADLVERLDPDPEAPPQPDPGFDNGRGVEVVFQTSDPSEMQVVKSILRGAEIPFLADGMESFKAFRGGDAAMRYNPLGGSVVFTVPADRAEEARILLTATNAPEE